jgi:hypothetical protein
MVDHLISICFAPLLSGGPPPDIRLLSAHLTGGESTCSPPVSAGYLQAPSRPLRPMILLLLPQISKTRPRAASYATPHRRGIIKPTASGRVSQEQKKNERVISKTAITLFIGLR